MQIDAKLRRLLAFSVAVETLTGAALLVVPSVVARLLLGGSLGPEPAVVARLCGVALLSLGVACWPGLGNEGVMPASLRAILAYNAMAGMYLIYVWARGDIVGVLLLAAWAFHVAMALSLGALARSGGSRSTRRVT